MPENLNDWLGFIVPEPTTNYVPNPSFEFGEDGWTYTNMVSARLGAAARSGGFGVAVVAADVSNFMVSSTLLTTVQDDYWTVSASIRALGGQEIVLYLQDAVTFAVLATVTFPPGDNKTRRLSATSALIPAGTSLRVVLTNTATSGWLSFYLDAIQVEPKPYMTTYCDGDQPESEWIGVAHASPSRRSVNARSGGRKMSFRELGINVRAILGAGAAPVEMVSEPYATLPGSEYQKTTVNARVMTLVCQVNASSREEFHELRDNLLSILTQQRSQYPMWLWYSHDGIAMTQIGVYYEGGLELAESSNYHEAFSLRLVAPDPYWQADHDLAIVIDGQNVYPLPASVGLAIRRKDYTQDDPSTWGWQEFGTKAGDSVTLIRVIETAPDGTVYVAGNFSKIGGVTAANVAYWDGVKWNAMAGGVPADTIQCFAFADTGLVYVGGSFTTVNGGALVAQRFASWNPVSKQWGAPQNYSSGTVMALAMHPSLNRVYIGGNMVRGLWVGLDCYDPQYPGLDVFDTSLLNDVEVAGGSATVNALVFQGGDLFIGGNFTIIGWTVMGLPQIPLTAHNIFRWRFRQASDVLTGRPLATAVTSSPVAGFSGTVNSLAASPDGKYVYAGGYFVFSTANGSYGVAVWSGASWSEMGRGIRAGMPDVASVGTFRLRTDKAGYLWASGAFAYIDLPTLTPEHNVAVGGNNVSTGTILAWVQNVARWNGVEWTMVDAMFYGGQGGVAGQHQYSFAIAFNQNDELIMSSIRPPTGIIRPATFNFYPKPVSVAAPTPVRFRLGLATSPNNLVTRITNWSTGQELYFKPGLRMQYPSIEIDTNAKGRGVMLTPNKSGNSWLSGDSSLAAFWLKEGENRLSIFTPQNKSGTAPSSYASGNVMYFRERTKSIDAIPQDYLVL